MPDEGVAISTNRHCPVLLLLPVLVPEEEAARGSTHRQHERERERGRDREEARPWHHWVEALKGFKADRFKRDGAGHGAGHGGEGASPPLSPRSPGRSRGWTPLRSPWGGAAEAGGRARASPGGGWLSPDGDHAYAATPSAAHASPTSTGSAYASAHLPAAGLPSTSAAEAAASGGGGGGARGRELDHFVASRETPPRDHPWEDHHRENIPREEARREVPREAAGRTRRLHASLDAAAATWHRRVEALLDEAEAGTEGVKQRTEAEAHAGAGAGAGVVAGAGAGACSSGDAPPSPAAPEPEPVQSPEPEPAQSPVQSTPPPPQHGASPMHTAAEVGPGRRGEYLRGEYREGEHEAWEAREARAGLEERGGERAEGERAEAEGERAEGEQPAHSTAFGESFEECSARLAAVHQRQVTPHRTTLHAEHTAPTPRPRTTPRPPPRPREI